MICQKIWTKYKFNQTILFFQLQQQNQISTENIEVANLTLYELLLNNLTKIFTAVLICLKMAVYEVFAHPELRRYKTHICTKASLLTFCVLFLVFIPPLFVVYRSYGKIYTETLFVTAIILW